MWRRGSLLFSDIPNKRIARWRRLPEGPELTTYATGMSNGLTLDRQGHVLAAEHDGRRVTRVADDGTRTVLADQFQGKRLNSPNDIVVKSDGSIYFTDPPYAVQPATPGMTRPGGMVDQAHRREGAALQRRVPSRSRREPAPRGGRLHAAERPRVLARRVRPLHRRLRPEAHPGIRGASGRHADQRPHPAGHGIGGPRRARRPQGRPPGNVFCTGPGGVWVCRADGALLGRIVLPELPANLAWGEDGSVLFLTARTSVYRLQTKTRGALLA